MHLASCYLNLRAVFSIFFFFVSSDSDHCDQQPAHSHCIALHSPLAMSTSAVPSARVDASAVASVKRALQAWEASFERQNGRRPQAKDVQGHNIGQSDTHCQAEGGAADGEE